MTSRNCHCVTIQAIVRQRSDWNSIHRYFRAFGRIHLLPHRKDFRPKLFYSKTFVQTHLPEAICPKTYLPDTICPKTLFPKVSNTLIIIFFGYNSIRAKGHTLTHSPTRTHSLLTHTNVSAHVDTLIRHLNDHEDTFSHSYYHTDPYVHSTRKVSVKKYSLTNFELPNLMVSYDTAKGSKTCACGMQNVPILEVRGRRFVNARARIFRCTHGSIQQKHRTLCRIHRCTLGTLHLLQDPSLHPRRLHREIGGSRQLNIKIWK